MTSEQPPRDAMRPLRPLPSIGVPLLREERSALRSRRLLWVGGSVLGLALSVGCVYLGLSHLGDEKPPPPAETDAQTAEAALGVAASGQPSEPAQASEPAPAPVDPDAIPVFEPGKPLRYERPFGKAPSFTDSLLKNGLSGDEANAVVAALNGKLDFRRAQPDDLLIVERDEYGELSRFEYRASLTQRYEAVRASEGTLRGDTIKVPVRKEIIARGGVVTGSLGDTLEGLSLGRGLAGLFTEVFEGRINFSTDTRHGDSFRIIFEEEYVDDTWVRHGVVHALSYNGQKSGVQQAFWYEPEPGQGDYYDANGRALHGGWLRTPLRYDYISSGYGMRVHPVLKRKQLHNGIDYAAATGTPIYAAAAGTVTFAGRKGPNGNLLSLSHAGGYATYYAHLSRFARGIKRGVKVKQRQLVAYVGTTGRSTGPHLHFTLKRRGKVLNPKSQLNGPGLPLSARDRPAYKRRVKDLREQLAQIEPEEAAPVSANAPPNQDLDTGEEEL